MRSDVLRLDGSRPGRRISLLFAVAALGFGALLQATLAPRLTLLGARVDLVLLLVAVWAITREPDEAVLWGLLGGALVDLFSVAPFGTTVLTLGVVAVAVSWLKQLLRRSPFLATLVLAPLATVVADLLRVLILQQLGWPIDYPAAVALVVLPGCVVNTLAAPVVYAALAVLRPRSARALRYF